MTGFVGVRARKKRRNFLIFSIFLILILVIYFFFPNLYVQNNSIVPNNSIIPDPSENLTSFASEIEDLELSIFQKEQKIKFRDGQIENLKNNLKKIQLKYDNFKNKLQTTENDYNALISTKENLVSQDSYKFLENRITELKADHNKNMNKINNLSIRINELNKSLENISKENNILKKNNKEMFANNLKSKNIIKDLNLKISEQIIKIANQNDEIQKLKDNSHHGN